tara:strand:- start:3114 stop:3401 length:288 start_codon:yes stop_codon:yes gene_type:complete
MHIRKLYQNGKRTLEYDIKDCTNELENTGWQLAKMDISYTVYNVNEWSYEVTNDGSNYWKWNIVGVNNSFKTQAKTKSDALDILKSDAKYRSHWS